jgi:hypothetical protein
VSSVGKSDHFEEAKEIMPLRKTTSATPSSESDRAQEKSTKITYLRSSLGSTKLNPTT